MRSNNPFPIVTVACGSILLIVGLTLLSLRTQKPTPPPVAQVEEPQRDFLKEAYDREVDEYEKVRDTDIMAAYVHSGIIADLAKRRGRYELYGTWTGIHESEQRIMIMRNARKYGM